MILQGCSFDRRRDRSTQLQAWLETEAQLQRVLQALGSLLDHLPALARAADSANFTPEADLRGEPARIPASASEACHVKQVLEAERLAAYLGPLMYVDRSFSCLDCIACVYTYLPDSTPSD